MTEAIREPFKRVGRTSIYKSRSKVVVARWSQRYKRKGQNYWYALTARDIMSIKNYGVTYFTYVCSSIGVVLISASNIVKHVQWIPWEKVQLEDHFDIIIYSLMIATAS